MRCGQPFRSIDNPQGLAPCQSNSFSPRKLLRPMPMNETPTTGLAELFLLSLMAALTRFRPGCYRDLCPLLCRHASQIGSFMKRALISFSTPTTLSIGTPGVRKR